TPFKPRGYATYPSACFSTMILKASETVRVWGFLDRRLFMLFPPQCSFPLTSTPPPVRSESPPIAARIFRRSRIGPRPGPDVRAHNCRSRGRVGRVPWVATDRGGNRDRGASLSGRASTVTAAAAIMPAELGPLPSPPPSALEWAWPAARREPP